MSLRYRVDQLFPWVGYEVARGYMADLNKLGHLVMVVAASKLVDFVVTSKIAIAVFLGLIALALILGRDYRCYDKELVRSTSFWGILKLLRHAWQFWFMMYFFVSLGIGAVDWAAIETLAPLATWVGCLGLLYEFLIKPRLMA